MGPFTNGGRYDGEYSQHYLVFHPAFPLTLYLTYVYNFLLFHPSSIMSRVEKYSRKKRSTNWTWKDACVLMDLYAKYHHIIIGQGNGQGSTPQQKNQAWNKLHYQFNTFDVDQTRELDEIGNKISNSKDAARKYANELRRWEIVGGLKPPDPPAFILKMFHIVQDSSDVFRLETGSGIDRSAGGVSSNAISDTDGNSNEDDSRKSTAAVTSAIQVSFSPNIREESAVNEGFDHIMQDNGPSVIQKYSQMPSIKRRRSTEDCSCSSSALHLDSTMEALQRELLTAQVAMIREQTLLFQAQREKAVAKKNYLKVKTEYYQRQLCGNDSASIGDHMIGTDSNWRNQDGDTRRNQQKPTIEMVRGRIGS